MRGEFIRTKEFMHLPRTGITLADTGVVRAKTLQKFFIGAKEWGIVEQPLIPQDDHAAAGFQEALELAARQRGIKPMESLGCGDEINAVGRQSGGFRRTCDACKAGIGPQELFARGAHFRVRLDAENAVAMIQEKLAQQASAGADVRYRMVRLEIAPGAQQIQKFARISGAVTDIIIHAIGEALLGV